MHYKPLKITINEVAGIRWAIQAMRRPKGSEGDSYQFVSVLEGRCFHIGTKDAHLSANLVKAGPDHAKFTRGIVVYFTIEMQVGFMIELVTYRIGVEDLSTSSTMHGELKLMKGESLAEAKQELLPDKVYVRDCMCSYQALRAMYRARRNHRHPDWQIWCDMIETLPYFDVLIYPEFNK